MGKRLKKARKSFEKHAPKLQSSVLMRRQQAGLRDKIFNLLFKLESEA
jgi:hypothetical protein